MKTLFSALAVSMAFNIIPPIPTSINQTKNIFGSVQNNFKKNTNKVEAVVTNTTSGLKNLTEIGKPITIFFFFFGSLTRYTYT